MAKKSESTLAKEVAFKAAVAEYRKSLNMAAPINLSPQSFGRALKGYNCIARRIKLSAVQTAWLFNLRQMLFEKWPYNTAPINAGFVSGDAFLPQQGSTDGTFAVHMRWGFTNQCWNAPNGLSVRIYNGEPYFPRDYVMGTVLTSSAYAIHWPNEVGVTNLYMHPLTYGAKKLTDKKTYYKYIEPDLIAENVKNATWRDMADFIEMTADCGGQTPRKAICDMLKAIALRESQKEVQEMAAGVKNA